MFVCDSQLCACCLSYDINLRFSGVQVRAHMQLARAARKLGHDILMQHHALLLYRAPAGLGTGPAVRMCRDVRHAMETGKACSGFARSAAASSATSAPPAAPLAPKQQTEVSHPADSNLEQAGAAPAAVRPSTGGPSGPDRRTADAAYARQFARGSTPASIADTPRTPASIADTPRLGLQPVQPLRALNTAAEPDAAPCTQPAPPARAPEPDPRDAGAAPSNGSGACAEALAPAHSEQAPGVVSEGSGPAVASRSAAMCSGEPSGSAHSDVHAAAGSSQRPSVSHAPAVDRGTYISELHLWCACG